MAKASLNTELGTARGEVEALGKVVAQRASEAEDLKRSRAEASEGEERLQREIESVRSECNAATEASAAREESLREERRAQDQALEKLRDEADDLKVQLSTA